MFSFLSYSGVGVGFFGFVFFFFVVVVVAIDNVVLGEINLIFNTHSEHRR